MKTLAQSTIKKKLAALTKVANEQFAKASKAEKRVLIAKDIIERINIGQYDPSRGQWVSVVSGGIGDDSAQKVLQKNEVTCTCCALGSIFASCVVMKNNVTMDIFEESGDFYLIDKGEVEDVTGLKNIFTETQLEMIETTFEKGFGYYGVNGVGPKLSYNIRSKCIDFGNSYLLSKDRLLAIMKNIVTNKGTFKP